MTTKSISFGFTSQKDKQKDNDVSIDIFYQEKYKEMRRHRDYQLSTANWCTVILLAIIAGFVSLNEKNFFEKTQLTCCEFLMFKFVIILIICAIVVLGATIVNHSAKRYSHMRKWVTKYIEPTINGMKYEPEEPAIRIQNVIISELVILGILASIVVLII